MKNLRQMLRQSGNLFSGKRRHTKASRRRGLGRMLTSETLESRELLAGDVSTTGLLASDFAQFHNAANPADVNADNAVSPLDALLVINEVSAGSVSSEDVVSAASVEPENFYDVNADSAITPLDALLVINALATGEGEATPDADDVVDLRLTALRDPLAGTPAAELDSNLVSTLNPVQVGEVFNLEVSFEDLSGSPPIIPDLGLASLVAGISPSTNGILIPALNETQQFVIGEEVVDAIVGMGGGTLVFSLEGDAAPGVPETFEADITDLNVATFTQALETLGVEPGTFVVSQLTAGVAPLTPGTGEVGFEVLFTSNSTVGQDLPDLSLDIINTAPPVNVEFIEILPTLDNGAPNPAAIAENLNTFSRSTGTNFFNQPLAPGSANNFDPATGLITIGALNTALSPFDPAGIDSVEPFGAFSIPVVATAPIDSLTLNVLPGDVFEPATAFPGDGLSADNFFLGPLSSITIAVEAADDVFAVDNAALTFEEDGPAQSIDLATLVSNGTPGDAFALVTTASPLGDIALVGSTLTFTPAADAFGTEDVIFSVTSSGATLQGTVAITVNAVNDAPVAVDDSAEFNTSFGTPLTIPGSALVANDTDVDNVVDDLTVAAVFDGIGGTVELVGSDVVFTPAAGFSGPATFTYQVTDSDLTSANAATVTVIVADEVVLAPVANLNVPLETDEDVPTLIPASSLLDLVAGGPAESFNFDPSTLGTLVFDGTNVNFTPAADLFGTETISFTATNSSDTSNVGSIDITVNAVNDAPVAVDDAEFADENTPLVIPVANLLANDIAGPANETSDVLSIIAVSPTSTLGGTVVLDTVAGTITYTPPADVPLSPTSPVAPALDSFTYTLDDGSGAANATTTGTFNVTINNVLAAPVFVDPIPTLTTNDLTPVTVDLDSLIADNAVDSFAIVTPPAVTAGSAVIDPATNVLTFTPVAGFESDATIEISATNQAETTNAILTVNVNQNAAPVSPNVTVDATEDTPVTFSADLLLANASAGAGEDDVQNVVITAVGVGSAGGTAVINAAGGIDYTPAANFFGLETFEITITDDGAPPASGTFTLNVNVAGVNDPPASSDVTVDAVEDTALVISTATLLATASAGPLEDTVQNVTISAVGAGSAGGTAVVNAAGGIDYTPAADFFGTEVFEVTITDDGVPALTSTFDLTINVASVNDPPVAVDDTASTFADEPVTINVLANDNAGPANEDQVLTVTAATSAQGGVVINGDGTLTFTPAAGFAGQALISYTIADSDGATASATVTVTVEDFIPTTVSGSIFIDNIDNIDEVLAGESPSRNGFQDDIDAGIGGILVEVFGSDGVVIASVVTNASGEFSIENLPPDDYTIIYVLPDTLNALSPTTTFFTVSGDDPSAATVNADLSLSGVQTPGLQAVALLSSSFLRANEVASSTSNGGREGAVVAFDEEGTQEFFIAGEGFEDVLFSELVLSEDLDSAMLVIVREGVLTPEVATLDAGDFLITPDGQGVQFFGGVDDFDFVPVAGGEISAEFANFQAAVDQALAQLA